MVSRRVAGTALVAALALALGPACVSPTLPLPPPEIPVVTTGPEAGTYVLLGSKGAALPNAFVISINENPTLPRERRVAGTQAAEDGTFRIVLFASPGDRVDVTQERGDERSAPVSVQIPR